MSMISLSTSKVVQISVSSLILLTQPLFKKTKSFQRENQPSKHYDPFYYKGSSKISSLGPKSEEEVLVNRLENGFSNNIRPNSPKHHTV